MILFWVAALAIVILLYILLDGFDLGVGILFGFSRDEADRRRMLGAISPVWDGNETWLVLIASILFGAFPRVFATAVSAFYVPVVLALGALILRGVAFEFRYKAIKVRWLWDVGFAGGSFVASFVQGMAVGALAEGLPIQNGGTFGWLSPFSVLCGFGLCLGYALLGASWLVAKCEGTLRDKAYRLVPLLMIGVLIFLIIVFVYALAEHLRIMTRWLERPYLLVFPLIGAAASFELIRGVQRRIDLIPFTMSMVIFVAAFVTLAASFWPYMIPFSITIFEGAAPLESLVFMFWGAGLVVLPLTLTYTAVVYRIFRGKIVEAAHYD